MLNGLSSLFFNTVETPVNLINYSISSFYQNGTIGFKQNMVELVNREYSPAAMAALNTCIQYTGDFCFVLKDNVVACFTDSMNVEVAAKMACKALEVTTELNVTNAAIAAGGVAALVTGFCLHKNRQQRLAKQDTPNASEDPNKNARLKAH